MLYQFIDLTRQIAKYDFMNMKKKTNHANTYYVYVFLS